MPGTRQLAAIMFTDIVGYTALMGTDEQKAFSVLEKNRQIQKPLMESHRGRWLKEIGDGVLASFESVSDAVYAAIAIQEACEKENDLKLRIGIHLGEVVFHESDVFGDGVNIASRLEAVASPGEIVISESVQRNIKNKKDLATEFLREEILKNVDEPIRIYQVNRCENTNHLPGAIAYKPNAGEKSIAVLPFLNMSDDPENEYFCEGLSEELLNVLSQIDGLRVAARTSSFLFKEKGGDIREIGHKLKVNTVLEGSVRKAGNRLRITAQLINVSDGYHLWSKRYDKQMEDIFDIQDEISMSILDALKVKLLGEEKNAILKKYTDKPDVYQLYLQGRFHYNKWAGGEGYLKALKYYKAVIDKEPEFTLAHTGLAACYLNLWFFSHLAPEESLPQMKESTRRALELDDRIAETHVSVARMKFWYEWDFHGAEVEFKKAIALNDNNAEAYEQYAMLLGLLERDNEALMLAKKACELDPYSLMINWGLGWVAWMTGDYELMHEQGKKLIEFDPDFYGGHLILGCQMWATGNFEEAATELKITVSQNYGSFTLCFLGCMYGTMGDEVKAKEILDEIIEISNHQFAGNFDIGLVYVGMGKQDEAVKWMEMAVEQHEGMCVKLKQFAKHIPWFNTDPRMHALFKKVGL
jgi:TolB-like protein/class 3 adenylate cyclase/Tfp pilus assembly protein PilF